MKPRKREDCCVFRAIVLLFCGERVQEWMGRNAHCFIRVDAACKVYVEGLSVCKNHTQNSIRSHANLTARSPHQEQSAMEMTVWQQIFPLSTVFFGRNILFLPNKTMAQRMRTASCRQACHLSVYEISTTNNLIA